MRVTVSSGRLLGLTLILGTGMLFGSIYITSTVKGACTASTFDLVRQLLTRVT